MRYLGRLLAGKKKIPGPTPAYDNDVVTHFITDLSSKKMTRIWAKSKDGFVVE
mgnify:CR=1 FL=1